MSVFYKTKYLRIYLDYTFVNFSFSFVEHIYHKQSKVIYIQMQDASYIQMQNAKPQLHWIYIAESDKDFGGLSPPLNIKLLKIFLNFLYILQGVKTHIHICSY